MTIHFSSAPNGRQTKQMRTPTAQTVFDVIRTGSPGNLPELCNTLRKLANDKEAARDFKWQHFPVFIPGGVFTERKVTGLQQHSGLVIIDYDDVADADTLRNQLTEIPHTLAAFVSPSGTGCKALVPVNPVPIDGLQHYTAFDAALRIYADRLPEHASHIDAAGRDVCRLCFYSFDPDIYVYEQATPIDWTPDELLAKKQDTLKTEKDASQDAPANEDASKEASTQDKHTTPPNENTSAMEDFLRGHGVGINERNTDRNFTFAKFGKGTRFRIDCVFNQKHKNDAWAFEPDDGPWIYKCSHNSCKDYGWEQFRQVLIGKSPQQAQAESKAQAKRMRPEFYNERGLFLPITMSDHLLNSRQALTLPTDGQVRFYENGVYRTDSSLTLEKAVIAELGQDYQPVDGEKTRKVIATLTMIPLPPSGEQPCQHPWHLNLENGILDIRTGELTEHSPEDAWIHQLPIRFNPDATSPHFDAWLHETQEGRLQDIELIHEVIGVCMLQQVLAPHIYILLGPTHTGKSTMLDVITACLGETHVSNVAFHELGSKDDKFASAQLAGALANLDRDITFGKIDDVGRLKKIAGGERISVQHKGQNRFNLKPFATIVGATNESIRSADWTDGWYQRLIVMDFQAQHLLEPKRNQVALVTTDAERAGILNHALAGIRRMLDTGKHTESEAVAANRKKFQQDDNQVFRWFDENFTIQPDSYLLAEDIEQHYEDWCNAENIKPGTKKRFRDTLAKYGSHYRKRGTRNARYWVYLHLAEKRETDDAQDIEPTAIDVPF